MEHEPIPHSARPLPAPASTHGCQFAVDFNFDDQAPPGTHEVALVLGILADILDDVFAAPEPAEEN